MRERQAGTRPTSGASRSSSARVRWIVLCYTGQVVDRSQLLKGTLDVALLAALGDEPNYGHGLFAALADAGLPGLADPSVYGALRRLELEGMLESELVQSASGPARKYYRLTPAGRSARREALQAWEELVEAMERILLRSAA